MMMMWDDDGGVMLVSFLADTTLHWEDPPHRTLTFPREFLHGLVKLGTGSEILIPMDAFWAIRCFKDQTSGTVHTMHINGNNQTIQAARQKINFHKKRVLKTTLNRCC